jgi:hypothetical protein
MIQPIQGCATAIILPPVSPVAIHIQASGLIKRHQFNYKKKRCMMQRFFL